MAWIAFSLASVLGLQLWMCWGKLGLPFLDTRLHYNYDNADYSVRARSGIRNGDLRSQFGVTLNAYSRWGERAGRPAYYTDHPFLIKALFQQYARIVGTKEWASRSFYLLVSFAIAAGVYTIFLQATGSLPAALAGTVTLVSLPLFAVYQTCVKFETDGILVSVWLLVALMAYLRHGTSRALAAYGILTGLAFLTHWTAILFIAVVGAYLLQASRRRSYLTAKSALLVTVMASVLGVTALAGCMIYLQRGWGVARSVLARAFRERSASISLATWGPRQWVYAKQNFGEALPWVVLCLALFLSVRWVWSRLDGSKSPTLPGPGGGGFLALFGFATLIVATVWLFAFRQGSFIHVYWQLWFCLPIATLVAAFMSSLRTRALALIAGSLACGALIAYLLAASRASYAGVLDDQLGTKDDIDFLSSLRDDRFSRLVFVPITDTPLNQWFQGPLFEYYTDRPVVVTIAAADLNVGEKVVTLRYQRREQVVAALTTWSGKRLSNEKCASRLCAYDVLER